MIPGFLKSGVAVYTSPTFAVPQPPDLRLMDLGYPYLAVTRVGLFFHGGEGPCTSTPRRSPRILTLRRS